MLSFLQSSRIYSNQLSNTRRQLSSFISIFPIQSNVNHSETRKLSTCKLLSIDHCSVQSKETLLTASHSTSQIYSLQNFSSSSRFNDSRQSERDARTLFVTGLSKDTTEDSLRKYFSRFWDVTNCKIIRDKMTGISRQFGFVELATVEEAEQASLSTERHFIDCKVVNVQMRGNKELEEKYRIFVGHLSKETSKETLLRYFSQFGVVFACAVHYNEDNLSRGFGSVTYKSQDSVDRALNSQPHSIDNKVVTVEHADSRSRELTMFIGNLSRQTTDESLRKHFSKYCQVTHSEVKIDRQTGKSRGFGYLNRALQKQPHMIDDVKVKLDYKTHELNLMVDSLPRNISEESLKKSLCDYFSRYGQVRDCMFIKNSVGTTTAFVAMSGKDEISRALADRPHRINGKLVDTHLKGQQFTLLLYDLPSNTTDKDLEETFSKVAKPIHWEVKRNRKLNANFPTINGYVSFSSPEEVDRVMEHQPYYSINGEPLTIQRKVWMGRNKR
ncbi:RNA recognition motif domain-containing protein [Ditylenchus destructor]|nr:RNA recognition motif domain-containing protein [Ditylenchus destructor]